MTTPSPEKHVSWPKRHWRLGIFVLLALCASFLAVWMVERTLKSHNKKRAMQSWLDDKLNADVSLLGDMVARLNLVRNSRLMFHNVEVEHPNIIFPGKFAAVERMAAYTPPWSMLHLWPGHLALHFTGARFTIEENEAGERSSDGLLRPLVSADIPFPFPFPLVSDWSVDVEEGCLTIRRHGYELNLDLDFEITGSRGAGDAFIRIGRLPFTFGKIDAEERLRGSAGPATISLDIAKTGNASMPPPTPGKTRASVQGLPAATLPFFFNGIPLENTPGFFNGTVRYDLHNEAHGLLAMDGVLKEVPLSVFGLSRDEPIALKWPVRPRRDGLAATLHMGPTGYGGFDIDIPLDMNGNPTLLSMRGSVAALDDIPVLLAQHSRWTDWLSRNFPAIEWRARKWLGFGWSGDNLQLGLSRTIAGMNLKGEAEMMNGQIRVSMTPDVEESPVTVAAERLDAQPLAAKLSQLFSEPFKVRLTGSYANLDWQGAYRGMGKVDEWGALMVFVKPEIDVSASGSWWKGLSGIPKAVIDALPDWGGGDSGALREIAGINRIRLDQIAIVSEWDGNGNLAVEFRAYGDDFGQATGMIKTGAGGVASGEFLLAGSSLLIETVEKCNPVFGKALSLLANDSMGLRVAFHIEPGHEPVFSFPFLEDAKSVHQAMNEQTRVE